MTHGLRQVILTRGLPASGKSTWAKELVRNNPGQYKRISKDDLREMLDISHWTKNNEEMILELRNHIIHIALNNGKSAIIDDTNLHPKHEDNIRRIVKIYNENFNKRVQVVIKDFTNISLEECIKRDLARPNSVGPEVIRKMWKKWLSPLEEPPTFKANPGLPEAVIVDIDGTLALHNSRGPYEAEKCETDLPNVPVVTLTQNIHRNFTTGNGPCQILLVSGRSEDHRPQTERWLAAQGIEHTQLWMRPSGDRRKDVIVKKEIYESNIKDRYFIQFVLDDRLQTTQGWRELGLTCLQVAEGNF